MDKEIKLTFIWLALMAITILNAIISETDGSGIIITLLVAASVSFKGQMIIDHFMGLKHKNKHLRRWMKIYLYVIPLLIVIVFTFPDFVAQLTKLN